MNTTLNQLQARRAELLKELASVEEAILHFGDATPVRIETSQNLRNTAGITCNPETADDNWMLVFADSTLKVPANKADHSGWVSKSALAEYKRQYPNWKNWLSSRL